MATSLVVPTVLSHTVLAIGALVLWTTTAAWTRAVPPALTLVWMRVAEVRFVSHQSSTDNVAPRNSHGPMAVSHG